MNRKALYLLIAGLVTVSCHQKKTTNPSADMSDELTMVVGTYTSGSSEGIYTFRINQETGEATPLSSAKLSNPSYLTISSDNKFVYAVSETGDGSEAVSAFSFNKEKGELQLVNSQAAAGGDPCYIVTNGKCVVTANYSGGSISIFPVQEDGSILPAADVIAFSGSGPDEKRQSKPHLHCVRFTPDGKYLLANDLGTDLIYKFDVNPNAGNNKEAFLTSGTPPAFKVPSGSGPRHITFSPNGKYAYLITELSGMVIAFEYNDGMLSEIQSIPADTVGARGSADIHVSPDGKFLYASTRLQADGLAIFSINKTDGTLTRVAHQLTGVHPRNFIITPNGKYLLVASRDKNAIEVYLRDQETGLLTDIEKDIKVDKPVCLKFAK